MATARELCDCGQDPARTRAPTNEIARASGRRGRAGHRRRHQSTNPNAALGCASVPAISRLTYAIRLTARRTNANIDQLVYSWALQMEPDARYRAADLITEIYAALLGTGSWQTFLDNISSVLPNGRSLLFYHDVAARTGAFSLYAHIDQESAAAYNSYYAAKNPWMAKATARPLGLGVRAELMLPRRELISTEFYADYLRPLGVETGVGVTVFRDQTCNFMLSVLCAASDDDQIDSAAALIGELAPHLRQAFACYRSSTASGGLAVDAAADALGVAIVSVGLDRRVRWANAAAYRLLSLGDPIGTDASGRIGAMRGEVREALDDALAKAARGEDVGKRTLNIRDREGVPSTRLTLVVPSLTPSDRYFAGPCVVLLVETIAAAVLPPDEALRVAFGLTPSEARIARAVADGTWLADVADTQGITLATARNHLKRIFAKMDVNRQAELVAKVHRYRG
jgi:DNA-binding CsgD family transcriptional regulator